MAALPFSEVNRNLEMQLILHEMRKPATGFDYLTHRAAEQNKKNAENQRLD